MILAGLMVGGCVSPRLPEISEKPPKRVLFVGNSFTYYNGGLEHHVQQLVHSAHPNAIFEAQRATQGGATLKILNEKPWVHERIREGGYDAVVLQEDLPEYFPGSKDHRALPFFENARRLHEEIRDAGGRTILFMAWPYERLNWITQAEIAQAHREIGRELGVPVAPVGLAFQRATAARPDLGMLGPDREHETIHGTYLAANVIYATLFGISPVGLEYRPSTVSAEDALFLQRVAWEAVRVWSKDNGPPVQPTLAN